MAERIQRRRTKGWRMPPGAVNVTRPSDWGNPFRVGGNLVNAGVTLTITPALAVALFAEWVDQRGWRDCQLQPAEKSFSVAISTCASTRGTLLAIGKKTDDRCPGR